MNRTRTDTEILDFLFKDGRVICATHPHGFVTRDDLVKLMELKK